MFLQRKRHRRITVSWKVSEQRSRAQPEKIDLLRPARRFARESETRAVREDIDRG